MIAMRRGSPALTHGEIELLQAPEPVLAFVRSVEGDRILCVFNLGEERAIFRDTRLPTSDLIDIGPGHATVHGADLHLGAHAARFVRLP